MKGELLVVAAVFLLLTIFIISRSPIAAFKPWLNWFDQWDKTKQYRCFSPTLMAYYFSPKFMYLIAKLFTKKNEVFPHDWYIDFIMSMMRAQARGVVKSDDAILTPRYLCSSVVPGPDDPGDLPNWHKRIHLKKQAIRPGANVDPIMLSKDLYEEWPDNPDDWRALMCADVNDGGWGCKYDQDPQTKKWSWNTDSKVWIDDTESRYSNFLAKYSGIPSDSSLIIGFVTGQRSWNGQILYPYVMHPLLGIHDLSSFGGWYGLLQSGDAWKDFDSLEVQSYIWGSNLAHNAPLRANCDPTRAVASGLSGGLMGGAIGAGMLSGGGEAAVAGAAAAGPGGIAMAGAAALGFLVFGALSGALDAAGQGCMDNK